MLGSEQANFALGLIGFGTGGSAAMGAEIFIKIATRKDKKETFAGRGRRLALRAKQQRRPQ
jgi:hypothetical protein